MIQSISLSSGIPNTISSREISELTGKRHADLLRDIRKMEESWTKIAGSKFALSEYKDSTGRSLPMYQLTKTECLYIATKFNDEARAKLVLKWEELENRKQDGESLNHDEILTLIEMAKVMFFVESRQEAEKRHFQKHQNPKTWHKHRNSLLNIPDSEELKTRLLKIGIKYKNKQQALMNLDKHELIRIGVTDLLIAFGKPIKYARSAGELAKKIAPSLQLNFGRFNEKLFTTPKEILNAHRRIFLLS
jgi:phage regulator Rha-like protein